MDEKSLRTSWKQRIVIIIIAVFMLGSTLATYIAVVIVNNNKSDSDKKSPELTKLEEEYSAKQSEINEYANELAKKYFDEFKGYKSNVKSYNAETVNKEGLTTKDLKKGDGKKLAEGDKDYVAYYIGFCPDESIFDSSFDDKDNPTTLNAPLSASVGLIKGWDQGVIGMHIGGVRELSIPGELAYGDSQEICGQKNSPLKFIVMPIEDEKLSKLNKELEDTYNKMMEQYQN